MKAQFATIEALVALIFVLSAVGFITRAYISGVQNAKQSSTQLLQGEALYDVTTQVLENPQFRACLSNYSSTGSDCIDQYLQTYDNIYKLDIAMAVNGRATGVLNGAVRCLPYVIGNDTEDVCISAGG